MFRQVSAAVAVAAVLGVAAPPALAQSTRAEVLERERAAKSTQLRPYEPGRIEKALLYVEQKDPLARIAPRNGFFGQYGYTGKPVGSGIGFGGGYRHDLFDRNARVVLEAGMTLRRYSVLRADFSLPYWADERVEFGVEAAYRRHPQEDYYGRGNESIKDARVDYLYKHVDVQGRAVVRPAPWLAVAARLGRLAPSIASGKDARFPSIEERFTDLDAPGLVEQPDFTYVEGSAAVDYRDQPGNARSGGYYAIAVRKYDDSGTGSYDFRRVDLHLQQFLPIFDKKRVIALQGRWIATTADEGARVPFYFQPTLGGSTTLRGFSDYRFRDDRAMYLNAEYRWEAFSGLDMALFSDWGKVASEVEDLDFSGLKHAYGIGFRFNTYRAVFLRIDIAAGGGEGLHYYFKWSKAF